MPALAVERIRRLAETFNPRRKRVKTSSNEGNTENCSASVTYREIKRIKREMAVFSTSKMSSNSGGNGVIIMAMMTAIARATRTSL